MSSTSSSSRSMFSTRLLVAVLAVFLLVLSASAQSTNSNATQHLSTTTFTTLTTSTVTTATLSRSGNSEVPVPVVTPSVFNITVTATSTLTPSPTSTATPSATPVVLDTVIDPAFGVLGVLLIITGLPSAFWGHKNRWSSFFIIGFYTLSLICFVLILKYGVLAAVNPPNPVLRGMFVLASGVAGIAGGGVAIFFWHQTKYFIGAWGGFVFGMWIQCFRNGGLIRAVGLQWILYIGCATVGFILCTIPKIHYHILLVSTAFVGATAFILGVDCFTTAGLKEFYIWNLGFHSLFPKYTSAGIEFPVAQTMQIELGLIAALALMGGAVQLRVLQVLHRKLTEIETDRVRREAERDREEAGRFEDVEKEREEWERQHGDAKGAFGKHGRNYSGLSGLALLKDQEQSEGAPSPYLDGRPSSTFTLGGGGGERRQRLASGVSDFLAAPTPDDELVGGPPFAHKRTQSSGALPTLDLGNDIENDVPKDFISASGSGNTTLPMDNSGSASDIAEELKRKEGLLSEIQTIRRSIDALRSGSPAPSSLDAQARSRYNSFASRRTLSQDLNAALTVPSHARPPRAQDPRARVHSMDLLNFSPPLANSSPDQQNQMGTSIGRPSSAPLRDTDMQAWDAYVQDRKLLQPPSGVTPPIPTTPTAGAGLLAPKPNRASTFMNVPTAVTEALMRRQQRESAYELGEMGPPASGDPPLGSAQHRKASSSSAPVEILPPRRTTEPVVAERPQPPRTRTFEELTDRHREKMRSMQAPLTAAEREQAELAAAKSRWERARAAERDAMAKREAAKKLEESRQRGRKSADESKGHSRARSRSADRLAAMSGPAPTSSSKRTSTLKVEDWQRYQQEVEPEQRPPNNVKRDSRSPAPAVPFPASGNNKAREPARKARRDPPN